MAIFGCAHCGTALSTAVTRVGLPPTALMSTGCGLGMLPPLLPPATYAVDPAPSGPPYRQWADLAPGEAEASGVYAPVPAVSFGARGRVHVAPGTLHGTEVIEAESLANCYGFYAWHRPNLACGSCGTPVASYNDHCGHFQDVILEPAAVAVLGDDEPPPPGYADPAVDGRGHWSLLWEAAVGQALAHLLAASGGARLVVGDARLEQHFGASLALLSPAGGAAREVVISGGAHGPDALVIVPADRRGGRVPAGTIPLYADVWEVLADPGARRWLPRVEGWDDEPPELSRAHFAPDMGVFRHVLARLPAVREPWLREVYDRLFAGRARFG